MKKLETLAKELETVSVETLQTIVGETENVDVATLTESEKWCTLVYRELAKAIKGKNRTLLLDANYPKSKMHEKTEKELAKGQTPQWLVNYFRVVDDEGDSLIQVYTKRVNGSKGEIAFDLYTSCAELNREQLAALEEELRFTVQKRKDGTPRTSFKKDISYYGFEEIVKVVCAILESTENARAEARAAKAAAKAEAKKKAEEVKEEQPA